MSETKVWLVTGASKGLGHELIIHLLNNGYRVIATSRDSQKMQQLQKLHKNLLAISMDVTNAENVNREIHKAVEYFGRIDVVVNNAGYGLLGTLEELSDKEIRNVFDVNVFGVMNVTKAVLPILREQQVGHIINIASISGSVSSAATSIYSATKAAIIQLSEGLSKELEEFGIKVTVVCPGGFRTDFLDKSSLVTPGNEIGEYTLVRKIIDRYATLNQNQGGDPKKAAAVFRKLTEMQNPPKRLYLGSDALRMIGNKINEITEYLNEYKDLSQETDY